MILLLDYIIMLTMNMFEIDTRPFLHLFNEYETKQNNTLI